MFPAHTNSNPTSCVVIIWIVPVVYGCFEMSSPFSLAANNPYSESDGESDLSPDSPTVDVHCVASSEELSSTGWMFTGSYVVDMASNPAQFSAIFLDDLFKKLAQSTPVYIEHMILFVNSRNTAKNRVYSSSIRGYVHGTRTSMTKWKAWLGVRQPIMWTPLLNISLSDEYIEDSIKAEDPSSTWFILGKYGPRKRFRCQCTAFYFETSLDIDFPESSGSDDGEASYILQLVETEFKATVDINGFRSKGAEYVLVQCDARQLVDASAGSTVSVSIQGFIQSKQTDLQTWNDWFDARWSIAPGGLCSLEGFEEAISESSPWETIYTFGVLGKNNAGRKAASQASCVQSRAQHYYSFVTSAVPPSPQRSRFVCSFIS